MRVFTLMLVVLPAGVAGGQDSAPASTTPPSTVASAEKTVEQTASPELVGELVKELAITPSQAQAGAGTLFGLAKSRLSPADFTKVAGAVPGMDGLLAAAPAATGKSGLDALAGQAGGMVAAASTLSKLGLKPDTVAKFAPTLIKAVQSKGGAEVAKLLTGVLK
jgi:hypothetical protein